MPIKLGKKGFAWHDLHEPQGLKKLFDVFSTELEVKNPELSQRYQSYFSGAALTAPQESDLLVSVAPYVSAFLAELFSIQKQVELLKESDLALSPLFLFKRDFVQRRVLKKYQKSHQVNFDQEILYNTVSQILNSKQFVDDPELSLAHFVIPILDLEKLIKKQEPLTASQQKQLDDLQKKAQDLNVSHDGPLALIQGILDPLEQWVATLFYKTATKWVSFVVPEKLDFENLVPLERPDANCSEKIQAQPQHLRRRQGFKLTDNRMSQRMALGEVDYCIYCHGREKDSCSKGLHDKQGQLQKNALGIPLKGCPLDEKISEAHSLKKQGDALGALALIIIDNPMCPGTGHRICNDCMKACIFQKQEPVNIPEIETNALTQVLNLPYGFELYSLMTRWNPLNRKRPYALPYNGKNIMVVGMGPAGYTLAHYLINEGFGVVGVDGLKIEPLPVDLTHGSFQPIKDIQTITQELDERVLAGFGGVAEYGITVRWDKNFLNVIYLNLARRQTFQVYGGVRFGGTISIEDAWDLGFDHIAMATGAGKPTIVPMKNNLIRGVRKASDFLMALQLTGAFKKDNLSNLQIRLPAAVIGGGLTGVDTATEIMAYYPVQVEKFLQRFESLEKEFGKEKLLERATDEDKEILNEFIEHGKAVCQEKKRALAAGEEPNLIELVRSWGGVSLVYRKRMIDSPAYRLNHEEVTKALEEGIYFYECLSPSECHRGDYGSLDGMTFEKQFINELGKWRGTGEMVKIPARSVCVAAGTSPNTIYEKEIPGTFEMDEWKYFFKKYKNQDGTLVEADKSESGFFTSYAQNEKRISYYGDNHPDYNGNVVKAMASAKNGYPDVVKLFKNHIESMDESKQDQRDKSFKSFVENLDKEIEATVVDVVRLTPTIIEVVVKAPLAAKNFHPGQFYRLQNFESDAREIKGTKLCTEGIALTGAWTDKEKGLLSTIILEMGTSSRLCGALQKGQKVVLMGPTGAPTEIPKNETVLLAGGGLGNAVLFSIGKALKENGNKVVYFAGYKNSIDVFKQDEIEEGTDVIVWSQDVGDPIAARRPQDRSFSGNIVQAMVSYGDGSLGDVPISLKDVDRIIAIGSDRMMAAVKESRFTVLKPFLKKGHVAIGSINSSMQCMMKEVCAQCLQKHVDPETGLETKPVFSCFNQDQNLDEVDFKNLNERLQANHLSEMLSNFWLDYLFSKEDVKRV